MRKSAPGARKPERKARGPMVESGERFGDYLDTAMREAGVPSLLALVSASGVDRGTIYKWKNGQVQRPSRSKLNQIGGVVGRSADQFLAVWDDREAPVGRFLTDAEIERLMERTIRRFLDEDQTE